MKAFLKEVFKNLAVEYADVRVEEEESTLLVYRGRELEEVKRSYERGGILRIFQNGNWVSASFNDIETELPSLIEEKAKEAEMFPKKASKLKLLPPIEDSVGEKNSDPRRVSLDEKNDLLRGYNQILLSDPRVVTTNAIYQDIYRMHYFYSTEGRYIESTKTYTAIALRAITKDGHNIQEYGYSWGGTAGFSSLLGKESEAERIVKIAVDLLKAEPVRGGIYTIIIDPLLAGVFIHEAFGHLSEADHIYNNEKLQNLMKIGTRYGVDELSVVDDPTLPNLRGSYVYDDEGVKAKKTFLIKEGKIASHLHSKETAEKLNEELTGNARAVNFRFAPIVRMSNTYIEPRDGKFSELVSQIDDGLYVCGARGGTTELECFTFASQFGYEIKKGKIGKMVRDITIQGNVFETLGNIDGICDDLEIFGGFSGCGKEGQVPLPVGLGGPHIRIKKAVIGGR